MQGEFGLLSPGKRAAIVRRYPVCLVFFLCAVFSCFRNPPNSDMNYRICIVHTFLCVRIYTGVGHTNESAQHFDSKRLTHLSCAPGGIRTSCHGIHRISRPTLYPLSRHVLPRSLDWGTTSVCRKDGVLGGCIANLATVGLIDCTCRGNECIVQIFHSDV